MGVDNFIQDNENQCVSWSYNGKALKGKSGNKPAIVIYMFICYYIPEFDS